jgi:hypothetical protein
MIRKSNIALTALLFITSIAFPQTETALFKKLKSLKEISEVAPIQHDTTFSEAYVLMITQPIDHNNSASKKFNQRVFLLHRNFSKPTVLALEGYAADFNRPYELTKILRANQILVEHRYFGKSIPEKIDWNYLTVKQSAADHHKIVTLFKKIYSGKWISTGISKGGQATVFHKRFYPDDVNVAVPYVAPINNSMEDPRINEFLRTVGTDECRNKVLQFQRTFLKRRNEILPLLMKDAELYNLRFPFDWEFLYEFWTLEYSFAFWQYGFAKCEDIPNPNSEPKILFEHMKTVNEYNFYSESGMKQYAPSFVQNYKEIGYYNYDLEPFKDLLTEVTNGSNIVMVPKEARTKFDERLMKDVNKWLQKNSNNMIFIYGELDSWGATAVQLTGESNALKMVKKGGHHRTGIHSFEGEEKERIYSTLEHWLDLKIKR